MQQQVFIGSTCLPSQLTLGSEFKVAKEYVTPEEILEVFRKGALSCIGDQAVAVALSAYTGQYIPTKLALPSLFAGVRLYIAQLWDGNRLFKMHNGQTPSYEDVKGHTLKIKRLDCISGDPPARYRNIAPPHNQTQQQPLVIAG